MMERPLEGYRGSTSPTGSESDSRNREDVKGKMRRVVGDLESVLGELKTVVGDLQTLVSQIDVVTTQIDLQCTTSGDEQQPATITLSSGQRQLSAPALDPLPKSPASPQPECQNIKRSLSHSANFFHPSPSPVLRQSPVERHKPKASSVERILRAPSPSGSSIQGQLSPASSIHSRGSSKTKEKENKQSEHFAGHGHSRTQSDGAPFLTTHDLHVMSSSDPWAEMEECEKPFYVSTKVIKPRSRSKNKVSSVSGSSASLAWLSNSPKTLTVTTGSSSQPTYCHVQSSATKIGSSSQHKPSPDSPRQGGCYRKPPPVPREEKSSSSSFRSQGLSRINYQPSKSFLVMDHRGNNPKLYDNISAQNTQVSKKTPSVQSSEELRQMQKGSTCHHLSDVELDIWHSRDRGARSTAESTGASSSALPSNDLNDLKCGALAHPSPCSPGPDTEYCGVYEKQLEETLELDLAADTLEMYDTLDDTDSLPLGMEAQHARHPECNNCYISAEDSGVCPNKEEDSLGMSEDQLTTSSNDSFPDEYGPEYSEEDEENDGDDECDYDCDRRGSALKNADLLQSMLPKALSHRKVDYSWRTVVEP